MCNSAKSVTLFSLRSTSPHPARRDCRVSHKKRKAGRARCPYRNVWSPLKSGKRQYPGNDDNSQNGKHTRRNQDDSARLPVYDTERTEQNHQCDPRYSGYDKGRACYRKSHHECYQKVIHRLIRLDGFNRRLRQ